MSYPNPFLDWPIDYDAVKLIAESEGCKLKAYKCPAGVWTIGWGRTESVKPGDTCTQEEADQWLLQDICAFSNRVRELCDDVNLNELGAFTSLAYNIGWGGLKQSTARRKHNEGDKAGAAEAFKLWNKARVNGVLTVLPGLVTRRAREAALYLTPVAAPEPMTHEVASEDNPLLHSRTIMASGAALATMAIDTFSQFEELFSGGDNIMRGIIAALVAYIIWVRRDDWIRKMR